MKRSPNMRKPRRFSPGSPFHPIESSRRMKYRKHDHTYALEDTEEIFVLPANSPEEEEREEQGDKGVRLEEKEAEEGNFWSFCTSCKTFLAVEAVSSHLCEYKDISNAVDEINEVENIMEATDSEDVSENEEVLPRISQKTDIGENIAMESLESAGKAKGETDVVQITAIILTKILLVGMKGLLDKKINWSTLKESFNVENNESKILIMKVLEALLKKRELNTVYKKFKAKSDRAKSITFDKLCQNVEMAQLCSNRGGSMLEDQDKILEHEFLLLDRYYPSFQLSTSGMQVLRLRLLDLVEKQYLVKVEDLEALSVGEILRCENAEKWNAIRIGDIVSSFVEEILSIENTEIRDILTVDARKWADANRGKVVMVKNATNKEVMVAYALQPNTADLGREEVCSGSISTKPTITPEAPMLPVINSNKPDTGIVSSKEDSLPPRISDSQENTLNCSSRKDGGLMANAIDPVILSSATTSSSSESGRLAERNLIDPVVRAVSSADMTLAKTKKTEETVSQNILSSQGSRKPVIQMPTNQKNVAGRRKDQLIVTEDQAESVSNFNNEEPHGLEIESHEKNSHAFYDLQPFGISKEKLDRFLAVQTATEILKRKASQLKESANKSNVNVSQPLLKIRKDLMKRSSPEKKKVIKLGFSSLNPVGARVIKKPTENKKKMSTEKSSATFSPSTTDSSTQTGGSKEFLQRQTSFEQPQPIETVVLPQNLQGSTPIETLVFPQNLEDHTPTGALPQNLSVHPPIATFILPPSRGPHNSMTLPSNLSSNATVVLAPNLEGNTRIESITLPINGTSEIIVLPQNFEGQPMEAVAFPQHFEGNRSIQTIVLLPSLASKATPLQQNSMANTPVVLQNSFAGTRPIEAVALPHFESNNTLQTIVLPPSFTPNTTTAFPQNSIASAPIVFQNHLAGCLPLEAMILPPNLQSQTSTETIFIPHQTTAKGDSKLPTSKSDLHLEGTAVPQNVERHETLMPQNEEPNEVEDNLEDNIETCSLTADSIVEESLKTPPPVEDGDADVGEVETELLEDLINEKSDHEEAEKMEDCEDPFKCGCCDKYSGSFKRVTSHLLSCSSVKNRDFSAIYHCGVCSRIFTSLRGLGSHSNCLSLEETAASAYQLYTCCQCQQFISTSLNLKEHGCRNKSDELFDWEDIYSSGSSDEGFDEIMDTSKRSDFIDEYLPEIDYNSTGNTEEKISSDSSFEKPFKPLKRLKLAALKRRTPKTLDENSPKKAMKRKTKVEQGVDSPKKVKKRKSESTDENSLEINHNSTGNTEEKYLSDFSHEKSFNPLKRLKLVTLKRRITGEDSPKMAKKRKTKVARMEEPWAVCDELSVQKGVSGSEKLKTPQIVKKKPVEKIGDKNKSPFSFMRKTVRIGAEPNRMRSTIGLFDIGRTGENPKQKLGEKRDMYAKKLRGTSSALGAKTNNLPVKASVTTMDTCKATNVLSENASGTVCEETGIVPFEQVLHYPKEVLKPTDTICKKPLEICLPDRIVLGGNRPIRKKNKKVSSRTKKSSKLALGVGKTTFKTDVYQEFDLFSDKNVLTKNTLCQKANIEILDEDLLPGPETVYNAEEELGLLGVTTDFHVTEEEVPFFSGETCIVSEVLEPLENENCKDFDISTAVE